MFIFAWPPLAVSDVEMVVLDPVVYAGDTVRFRASLCKNVEASSELHFALVSDTDERSYYDAGVEYGNNPKGCFEVVQHFHVPSDIPPGKYEAIVVAVLSVNALRKETYRLPMGKVTVKRE
jgi:hypothetical protein